MPIHSRADNSVTYEATHVKNVSCSPTHHRDKSRDFSIKIYVGEQHFDDTTWTTDWVTNIPLQTSFVGV